MQRGGCAYIMSSVFNKILYVGVTSNLYKRVWEHKNKIHPTSFSAKYNCIILVYFKGFERIEEAIAEEKRIKAGNRKQKEKLIDEMNPAWKDLWNEIQP